jgi:dipeptidyl aminopeptidase/acylaminoacyl peptidase
MSTEFGASGPNAVSPALVIRSAVTGQATPVAVPCGAAGGCGVFSPVWSPDGSHIAFAVTASGSIAKTLYTADGAGGSVQQLATFDGVVVALHYAPDGKRLAMLAQGDATEDGPTGPVPPQTGVIGRIGPQRRIAIVGEGKLHWASPADLYVYEYDWLADGSGLVGTAAQGDGNANWWSARLYRFADGEARVIYAPGDRRQQIAQPKVSPDGASVSFIGGLMSDLENPGGDAFVLNLHDPAAPVDVTPGLPATVLSLRWGCTPGHLLASLVRGANGEMADIDVQTHAVRTLWSAPQGNYAADTAVSVQCGTATTATVLEDFVTPPEIAVGPIGEWRNLTAVNDGLRQNIRVQDLEWRSDGWPVQGWLLTPANADPAAPLKLITHAHGGPAWAEQPYYLGGSNRALLDHGYALFLPNPRGSYGQGEAFTQAVVRDEGGGDLRDILSGIDAAGRAAPIDESRLGIEGVSYGGYMTMWATTQTARFKAAVARAGISDWLSYAGQTGIGGWLAPYFGATVYEDPAIYARANPLSFIRSAHTPTLMLVGDEDIECPAPQSRQFWAALTALGTPAEMVLYPREGHEYWRQADEADAERRETEWFDRYLR